MTKTAVVTQDSPSVVSGERDTIIRNGEPVCEHERLPDSMKTPLHKKAAFIAQQLQDDLVSE